MVEERVDSGQERFRKFLKTFEDFAQSTETCATVAKKQVEIVNRQIDAVNRQIEASEAVFEAIMKDRDGAIAAVDDLIVEIQGLREDLRALAKASGMGGVLGSLLGSVKRGR